MRPVADGSMLATASFDNYVILWFVIAYASFVVLIYWYRSVDEAGRAQKLSSVSVLDGAPVVRVANVW